MPLSKERNKARMRETRGWEKVARLIVQMRVLQSRVTLLEADTALLEAMVRQAEEWSE